MSLVNKILEKITEFIKVKGEAIKLDIISQVSVLLAHVVAFLFLGVIVLFLIIFLSLALTAYLNELLESVYAGYLILSGFYLLVIFIILLLLRSNKIQHWLEALFIKVSENLNKDDE